MAKVKSDIEIARKAKMKPISKILAKINVPDKKFVFKKITTMACSTFWHIRCNLIFINKQLQNLHKHQI